MIDEYRFGNIIIRNRTYRNDVIIFENTIQDNWWRKKGHELCIADIQPAIEKFNPAVVVVGTGKFGLMKVLPETDVFLQSRQIRFMALRTAEACETFNRLAGSERILGAFHLTC